MTNFWKEDGRGVISGEKKTIDKFNENLKYNDIEEWDSIGHMTLVAALEEEFNIKFTDDESVEMLNYSLIKNLILSFMMIQK